MKLKEKKLRCEKHLFFLIVLCIRTNTSIESVIYEASEIFKFAMVLTYQNPY